MIIVLFYFVFIAFLNAEETKTNLSNELLEEIQSVQKKNQETATYLETQKKDLEEKNMILKEKLADLEKKEKKLLDLKDQIDSINTKKIQNLMDTISNMNPKAAAKLFNVLNDKLSVRLMSQMDPSHLAKILTFVPPIKASELSALLLKENH